MEGTFVLFVWPKNKQKSLYLVEGRSPVERLVYIDAFRNIINSGVGLNTYRVDGLTISNRKINGHAFSTAKINGQHLAEHAEGGSAVERARVQVHESKLCT